MNKDKQNKECEICDCWRTGIKDFRMEKCGCPKCHSQAPQKKDTSWEERFDEKYFSVYEKYPEYKESHSILLNDIKDFITKEIQKAKEDTIKEVIEKIDKNYLEYCRQYNGRNDCKNCGLNLEDLQTLLKQKI